jgi:hypothetical protein
MNVDIRLSAAMSDLAGRLALSVPMLLIVLFAWHQSHFQYDIYVEGQGGLVVYRLSVAATLMLAVFASVGSYPRPLVQMAFSYILVVLVYGVMADVVSEGGKLRYYIEAIVFALMMLPIVSSARLLRIFIAVNLMLATVLIALNTVTALHWLEMITLPYEQVARFGGEEGLFHLDPLHFGVFGLTENLPALANPYGTARLQGYSFEPLHWAYFVFLAFSCLLFLSADRKTMLQMTVTALLAALFLVHLFFVFSTTAFIAAAIATGFLVLLLAVRRMRLLARHESLVAFVVLVIVPGFLIPFVLVLIPEIGLVLVADDILNKGSNWDDKIDFLSLGTDLYFRFLPSFEDSRSASHNLVLSTYISFGYFLVLPLLWFLWMFIKRSLAGRPFVLVAGTALAIVAHVLVVPPQFFYASGAMWILMAAGVAYHYTPQRVRQPAAAPRRRLTWLRPQTV